MSLQSQNYKSIFISNKNNHMSLESQNYKSIFISNKCNFTEHRICESHNCYSINIKQVRGQRFCFEKMLLLTIIHSLKKEIFDVFMTRQSNLLRSFAFLNTSNMLKTKIYVPPENGYFVKNESYIKRYKNLYFIQDKAIQLVYAFSFFLILQTR